MKVSMGAVAEDPLAHVQRTLAEPFLIGAKESAVTLTLQLHPRLQGQAASGLHVAGAEL